MSKALIDTLSQPQVRQFIKAHLNEDPLALVLKSANYPDLPIREIARQIQSRKKAQSKLPEWFENEEVIFPPGVSLEQCSSEITAKYKASLVEGKVVTDLTGGFGIDLYYLSKCFEQANYVEQSEVLVSLAKYNYQKLEAKNVQFFNTTSEEYLSNEEAGSDLYYIDPARRDGANQKVFQIEDCTPDLSLILPLLLERKAEILIKMSPLLDIHQALAALSHVKEIHVVSVRNECKELLFRIEPDFKESPVRVAVNLLQGHTDTFEFSEHQEQENPAFSQPLNYLYEPNASIMKAGGFNSVANAFGLSKLHRNSHLYTSDKLIENFPGRAFHIEGISALSKKKLKSYLPQGKANITVRNYPMTVKEIRKKTGIKEGGDVFLFATTLLDQGLKVLVCAKS